MCPKIVVEAERKPLEGLMSQFGSMRFLLVSVVFALFFGSVAIALSAFLEEGARLPVVSTTER